MAPVGLLPVMVAVKVIGCPGADGLGDDVRVVVVVARVSGIVGTHAENSEVLRGALPDEVAVAVTIGR